jgi:trigger factor
MTDEQGDRRIMQVTETLNEGLKRGYRITLTAAELDAKVEAKLKEAQPQVELKGFRKGKVPMALLRRQFGKQVLGEAMQEAIDGAMNDHFTATGDRPAARPDVTMENADWKEGDDVAVALSYETLPDVPEIDFKAIAIERPTVTPTDEEVAEALDQLARNATTYADRDEGAAAESGDQVVIDFEGRIDGEAFPGGAAEDFPLVLGSEAFIPGFEDKLVGARAGEARDIEITFPADYGAEHLAGKDAVFATTVKAVQAPEAAEIDDALAKRYGAESLEALRGTIREQLGKEYAGAARQIAKRALLDALDGAVAFEVPPGMLAAEAGQIAHQLWHEEHPEVQGHDHDEIEPDEEHLKLAERRVRLGLLLAELGRKHKITVPEADLREAIIAEARRYPGQERTFFEAVQQNPGLQQQIRAPLFEDKVIDFLFELVEVTEKPMTKAELQEAVDRLSED